MKTHPPKLKTTPRPLFSCGLFRNCTLTVLSRTTSNPPSPLPQSHQPPPPPPPPPPPLSSSSSSSHTSQSFTQWRFPLPTSPISHHSYPQQESDPPAKPNRPTDPQPPPVLTAIKFQELFHAAEIQLNSDSDTDRANALQMLERSLVPNPAAVDGCGAAACPSAVMENVVGYLKDRAGAKSATKVLLALCIAEGNRRVAVELGAAGRVVEALADLEGAAAERALAALELLCTVAEGAAEVRAHALAVPMMVQVMGKMDGRGKEYAISVLAVIYGGYGEGVLAPPEEVARAVALALQGDCSARGRRKGAQLLKVLQESGRVDLTEDGR